MSPALLLATLVQTIWIVDAANGPGTNFTDLPAAVAAASSGDTILVRPGTYSSFGVGGKALTIRGASHFTTNVQGPPTLIDAVPAGSPFYLSGLSFVVGAPPGSLSGIPGFIIAGATTEVVLSDLNQNGALCCFGTPGLQILGGAVVHASRSTFLGSSNWFGQGGHGAVVTSGCKLVADACTFSGADISSTSSGAVGGNGVHVDGGVATLSRSSVFGGSAPATISGAGGQGVTVLNGGFARVAGIASNMVKGGVGLGGPSGIAVHVDALSSAIVHGSVTLVGGVSGWVTTGAVPLPYLLATGSLTQAGELLAGQPVTVTLAGQIPSAPFACIVDVVPTFSTALVPFALGELLVPVPSCSPSKARWMLRARLEFSFVPATSTPALLDVPVFAQFGVCDAVAGNVRLSNGWIRIFKP